MALELLGGRAREAQASVLHYLNPSTPTRIV